MKVAAHYQDNQKAYKFIPDVLQLGVSSLFSIQSDPSGQESQQDKLAVVRFEFDLRKFILQNKLKYSLLAQTKQMLVINLIANGFVRAKNLMVFCISYSVLHHCKEELFSKSCFGSNI